MTRTIVTAIVSGGQTGADRGGLQAAIDLGLGWGGWAPHGWRAEDGEVPAVYREHMRESASPHYGLRTRLNVQDSDGTLIVSFAENLSGGSAFTARTAKAQRKPARHLILPARGRTRITDAVRAALLQWIGDNRISVLNVAGPRESKEPGIQQAVRDALVWVLEDDHASEPAAPDPNVIREVMAQLEPGEYTFRDSGLVATGVWPEEPVVAPTSVRIGDPVDAPGWQTIIDANMAEIDKHQVHGAQVPDDFGPATRADLEDLDAVPEPVDSDAPPSTYLPGAAPIGPTAQTRPYRRVRHITGPDGVPRPETEDEERMHARTLARARK